MNIISLDGVLTEPPKIQFCKQFKNMMVAMFSIKNGEDEHDCFAVGDVARGLAQIRIDEFSEVSVRGSLQSFSYHDMYNTLHRTKYVLVYNFKTKHTVIECEQIKNTIDKYNREYISAGYHPLSIAKNCI